MATDQKSIDAEIEALEQRLLAAKQRRLAELRKELQVEDAKGRTELSPESRQLKRSNTLTPEKLLEAAARSLELYGTIVPPREAMLSVATKVCPSCLKEKPIIAGFGLRNENGKPYAQSSCFECRASKTSHPTRFGLPSKRRRKR